MTKVHLHFETAEDAGKRFVSAFKRIQKGERLRERHVSYVSVADFLAALSPKRLEVLKQVRKTHYTSVLALSKAMGRDYKRTYQDVSMLEAAGLIVRTDAGLMAPWKSVSAELIL